MYKKNKTISSYTLTITMKMDNIRKNNIVLRENPRPDPPVAISTEKGTFFHDEEIKTQENPIPAHSMRSVGVLPWHIQA